MTVFPQCFRCRHFHAGSGASGPMTCDAFPAAPGIPEAILTNEHDHREPFPGDHGVRFETKAAEQPKGA